MSPNLKLAIAMGDPQAPRAVYLTSEDFRVLSDAIAHYEQELATDHKLASLANNTEACAEIAEDMDTLCDVFSRLNRSR